MPCSHSDSSTIPNGSGISMRCLEPYVGLLPYQQECRYRREQLPRMLQKESGRLEEYLDRGLTTDFNPEKPWGYLYYMGANDEEDSRVSRWCHSNFEPKADFIITGLALIASYLGGDAEVCMSSSSHLATSGMSVHHAGQSGHHRPLQEAHARPPPCAAMPPVRRRGPPPPPAPAPSSHRYP